MGGNGGGFIAMYVQLTIDSKLCGKQSILPNANKEIDHQFWKEKLPFFKGVLGRNFAPTLQAPALIFVRRKTKTCPQTIRI
jgi:hypothetical protein